MITRSVTPAQFDKVKAELKAQYGVSIEGNQGRATIKGVTGQMGFDGSTLTLKIVDKPFLLPTSVCEGIMEKWLDGEIG